VQRMTLGGGEYRGSIAITGPVVAELLSDSSEEVS